MGIFLTLTTYFVLLILLSISFSRFLTLWNAAKTVRRFSSPAPPLNPLLLFKMAADILFLMRLLKTNDLLWIGEWVFHVSFLLVVLRHLRFFLTPVPEWVWHLQTTGLIAGYVLPLSLVYIFLMKVREDKYFPSYNFFLVVLLFLISATGLLMQGLLKSDTVNIKTFMTGVFTFAPVASPDGALFVIHFSLVLVFAAYLPAHIFSAPFVLVAARKREEDLRMIIHEK